MNSWDKRLKSCMQQLGLTQEELARKTGITRSAVSHYLANRRVPRMKQLNRIAAILKCEPGWLQYGTENNGHMLKRKKRCGGKLNRSEIIQARLDPKLHMTAEIMARIQRRTLSSLIESLLDTAIDEYIISLKNYSSNQALKQQLSIKEVINRIWSAEEADRFVKFAFIMTDLLNQDELRLWEFIISTAYFWQTHIVDENINDENWPIINKKMLIKEHLHKHWDSLKPIVEGNEVSDELQRLHTI